MGRTRLALIMTILIIGGVALLPVSANAQSISELNRKLEQLKKAEAESKKQIEQKKRDAANLRSVIDDINDDISYTESRIRNTQEQIDATNAVIAALNTDITTRSAELDTFNSQLKSAYVSLYELSQANTLEMILVASSLDELITKTQYVQELQGSLQTKIKQVEAIKAELESKKAESELQKQSLDELKSSLDESKSSLGSQRLRQTNLLKATEGEQARYEQLLEKIKKESSQISREIYERRLAEGGFIGSGGTGGYPWAGNCDAVDSWLYYTCQCTSYAAWKFKQIHGVPFMNTRPGSGSAYNWPALAGDQGYTVQYGGTPRIGDIVSWNKPLFIGDEWGHVAIVEQVNSATDVVVSEYNWSPAKKFSIRRIDPNRWGTPRYIRP